MIRSPPTEPQETTLERGRGIVQQLLKRFRLRLHGLCSTHGVAIATVVAGAGKGDCRVYGGELVERDVPRVPEQVRFTKEG